MKILKNLSLVLLLSFSLYINGFASSPFEITKGTKLIYTVISGESTYNFIAEITSLDNGISFDWKMTDPANINGKISIDSEGLKSARSYHNYFKGDTDLKLTDKSSIFLSNLIVDDLYNKGLNTTSVNLGIGEKQFQIGKEYLTATEHVDVNNNHLHISADVLKSTDNSSAIHFIQIGEYYLITHMEINFMIYLIEVVN